jgi:sporulation integral membrane protein YlbJ
MKKPRAKLNIVIIPLIVLIFNLLIIIFPRDVIQAAREGTELWLGSVLPSLLPFAVGVNLLSALGATELIGRLLERFTRICFNVSGNGGFVMVIGLLSGYPMGAKAAADLRADGGLSGADADRLICFVNNSGPLFILGAVAQEMFHNIIVGWYLICVHYISAILTGLFFRMVMPGSGDKSEKTRPRRARAASPLGAALSKSVINGMEAMLSIGGFIILFGVLIKILDVTNLLDIIEFPFRRLFPSVSEDSPIIRAALICCVEITNGLKLLSSSGVTKSSLVVAAAAISFGGFSIHAQSLSFIAKTDINAKLYMLGKLVQTVICIFTALLCIPFFYGLIIKNEDAVSVFKSFSTAAPLSSALYALIFFVSALAFIFLAALVSAAAAGLSRLVKAAAGPRRHGRR